MLAKMRWSSSQTAVVPLGETFGVPSGQTVATKPRRCSSTTRFMSGGRTAMDLGSVGSPLFRPLDGSHFDHASRGQRRDARRDRNRLVAVFALDQVVTAQLLLGLGERSVRDDGFAIFLANGDRAGDPVEF